MKVLTPPLPRLTEAELAKWSQALWERDRRENAKMRVDTATINASKAIEELHVAMIAANRGPDDLDRRELVRRMKGLLERLNGN